jgi:putative heme-binding domain-containing protein
VADDDPVVNHLALDALVKLQAADALLAALPTAPFAQRAGIARALQALHDPAVVRGLLSLLPKLNAPAGEATSAGKETRETRQLVLRTLARLAREEGPYTGDWWGTRPDTSGPYYKPVTWSESAAIETALAKELKESDSPLVQWLLPQLKKHKLELPGMQERIVQLAQADAAFFPTAIGLIAPGAADLTPEALQLLEVAATRPTGDAGLRVNALRALQRRVTQTGVLDAALRSLSEIGSQEGSAELRTVWDEFVREPALAKLVAPLTTAVTQGETPVRELAGAALAFVAEAPQAPAEARAQALKMIDQAWTEPAQATSLLRGIGRARLEAQIFQILQQRKSEVAEVRDAAQYAVSRLELDQEPTVDPNKPLIGALPFDQVVQQVADVKGDAKYGQRLFTRQGCVACHAVSQTEPVKGPLLLDISQRYKRPELVESIVKPSAKIAQGFEGQFFVTGNGKVFDGFVVRESGDEIELRNITGVATVLRKEDIEERGKRDISIMPQGLVDKLNVEQLAALLAYLESLKK